MMDNLLPKIKTIRIMLRDMSEAARSRFRMAFKMHNTTNYQILDSDSDEIPDLVLVDTAYCWGHWNLENAQNQISWYSCCDVLFARANLLQRRIWLSRLNSIPYSRFWEVWRRAGIFLMLRLKKAEAQEGTQNGNESRKATIRRFNPNKRIAWCLEVLPVKAIRILPFYMRVNRY